MGKNSSVGNLIKSAQWPSARKITCTIKGSKDVAFPLLSYPQDPQLPASNSIVPTAFLHTPAPAPRTDSEQTQDQARRQFHARSRAFGHGAISLSISTRGPFLSRLPPVRRRREVRRWRQRPTPPLSRRRLSARPRWRRPRRRRSQRRRRRRRHPRRHADGLGSRDPP